jgi:hypothetical protein
MKIYKVGGKKFTNFDDVLYYMEMMKVVSFLNAHREEYIDKAVEVSDMSEAKMVIKHIMELKSENKDSSN